MYEPAPDRAIPAIASLLIVVGGIAALIAGLAARTMPPVSHAALTSITVRTRPPAPPPREVPAKARSTAAKQRPSPANMRNKATQIVAPTAMIPPLIVPPVVTSVRAGVGAASANGASAHAGPGQGAGGIGNGLGGGGNGNGAGEDDGYDDAVTRPRQTKGRLHFSDLPADLRKTKNGGELKLQYRIGVDGRVSDCRIVVSSGRAELDATTCRLITERFRFRPSQDSSGRPVPSIMIETHGWFFPPGEE